MQPNGCKDEELEKAHAKFIHKIGDHLTLLHAFNFYVASDKSETWCDENYVNWSAAQEAYRVREQLEEIMKRLRLPVGYAEDAHQVERALVAGYFRKAVRNAWPFGFKAVSLSAPPKKSKAQKTRPSNGSKLQKLSLQMRSDCVFKCIPPGEMAPPKPPAFLVAHKLFRTVRGGIQMRHCTAIKPTWLTDPSLVPAVAIERLQLVQEVGHFAAAADCSQRSSLLKRTAAILLDATNALSHTRHIHESGSIESLTLTGSLGEDSSSVIEDIHVGEGAACSTGYFTEGTLSFSAEQTGAPHIPPVEAYHLIIDMIYTFCNLYVAWQ